MLMLKVFIIIYLLSFVILFFHHEKILKVLREDERSSMFTENFIYVLLFTLYFIPIYNTYLACVLIYDLILDYLEKDESSTNSKN